MNPTQLKAVKTRDPSIGEEIMNSITHGIGTELTTSNKRIKGASRRLGDTWRDQKYRRLS